MKLPFFPSLEDAIRTLFGNDITVADTQRVGGGDINDAYRITLSDGTKIFMKENAGKDAAFFEAEAKGLHAIEKTGVIRTPHVLCTGERKGMKKRAFLLMECIEAKNRIPAYWETFARELAAMHSADTKVFVEGGNYGFLMDNYIGERPQKNTAYDKWIPFFRDCRLEPQFRSASRYFSPIERKKINRLLERLDDYLIEPEHPSLLHGDLWAGNVIAGSDGKAWLIDPAVYVGCAEADLAMTELFGGFSSSFYETYRETTHLQPGYPDRRDLYNLYQLLNHLNLFGHSYLHSVRRILDTYVSSRDF